mmetsp:Transcript_15473/g.48377  ORF Transcript_15473/g.48377 Transcript_15473/m.48377 type:complete len:223 (-) Transcript_15473:9783-10451(-)
MRLATLFRSRTTRGRRSRRQARPASARATTGRTTLRAEAKGHQPPCRLPRLFLPSRLYPAQTLVTCTAFRPQEVGLVVAPALPKPSSSQPPTSTSLAWTFPRSRLPTPFVRVRQPSRRNRPFPPSRLIFVPYLGRLAPRWRAGLARLAWHATRLGPRCLRRPPTHSAAVRQHRFRMLLPTTKTDLLSVAPVMFGLGLTSMALPPLTPAVTGPTLARLAPPVP